MLSFDVGRNSFSVLFSFSRLCGRILLISCGMGALTFLLMHQFYSTGCDTGLRSFVHCISTPKNAVNAGKIFFVRDQSQETNAFDLKIVLLDLNLRKAKLLDCK